MMNKEELLKEIGECLKITPITEFMYISLKDLEIYKNIILENIYKFGSFAFKAIEKN